MKDCLTCRYEADSLDKENKRCNDCLTHYGYNNWRKKA
ncbi:hypothetical protein ES702_07298 [subsurface metagenome]